MNLIFWVNCDYFSFYFSPAEIQIFILELVQGYFSHKALSGFSSFCLVEMPWQKHSAYFNKKAKSWFLTRQPHSATEFEVFGIIWDPRQGTESGGLDSRLCSPVANFVMLGKSLKSKKSQFPYLKWGCWTTIKGSEKIFL